MVEVEVVGEEVVAAVTMRCGIVFVWYFFNVVLVRCGAMRFGSVQTSSLRVADRPRHNIAGDTCTPSLASLTCY